MAYIINRSQNKDSTTARIIEDINYAINDIDRRLKKKENEKATTISKTIVQQAASGSGSSGTGTDTGTSIDTTVFERKENKVTAITSANSNNTKYPSVKAVADYVTSKVQPQNVLVVTYDAYGGDDTYSGFSANLKTMYDAMAAGKAVLLINFKKHYSFSEAAAVLDSIMLYELVEAKAQDMPISDDYPEGIKYTIVFDCVGKKVTLTGSSELFAFGVNNNGNLTQEDIANKADKSELTAYATKEYVDGICDDIEDVLDALVADDTNTETILDGLIGDDT